MAKIIYHLCAKATSEDKSSGLFSIFELVEKIQLSKIPSGRPDDGVIIVRYEPMHVVTCWAMSPEDTFEDEFETELELIAGGGVEVVVGKATSTFRFGGDAKYTRHRLTAQFDPPPVPPGATELIVRARIRKKGHDDWSPPTDYPIALGMPPE